MTSEFIIRKRGNIVKAAGRGDTKSTGAMRAGQAINKLILGIVKGANPLDFQPPEATCAVRAECLVQQGFLRNLQRP